jgi:[protein-PII] uridylyltransferase
MTIAEKQLFDPAPALEERSSAVDIQVRNAWQEHLGVAVRAGAALLAVGGYGRRQLFPYSDVDLLLLFASDKTATSLKDAISRFLQQLWDAGLRVSQSVRTPAECAELHDDNIELSVSLLDQRYLAGDAVVYGALLEKLPRFVHGQRDALVRHLSRMTRERHSSFNGTFYHLEPNIKESPGGLRDLQLVSWLSQIAGTTPQSLAPPAPTPDLDEARHFLFGLRGYLHLHAKRDSNILTFDAQEWVAEQTGLHEPATLMRDYFRNARTVHRSALRVLETEEARASSLFAQFRDRRARVSNADFTVSRERVFFRSPAELDAAPELLLRLIQFVGRHGVRLSLEAEQRIAARLPALRAYFASPRPIWPAVCEALSLPYAPLALRAAHEAGALTALFPEMEEIDCLVIRDFYHRYTVDEHTLVAIQTLVQLRDAKDPSARPYAGLLSEIEQLGLLVFALLFHDVGKSSPEEGHVDASLRIAERAMERIQMPQAERETVRFVIRCHLEMSATMNGRDPFDPATAEYLAHKVGTVERLKLLTLVTYADISAVNPSAMTSWRAEQLWQLYLLTYNELTRELETERIEQADSPDRSAFLEGFPTRYLHTHAAAEIERHMQLELDSRARGASVEIEKTGSTYRLTLVTGDRPFLFASVAGTLSSFGMNILKAEAFANRRGTVLDTFSFADPVRTLELNPTEVDRLKGTVERAALGRADVRQLLRSRPRPAPPSRKARIEPAVSVDDGASESATLIQVVAEDRPGLLYDIASTISSHQASIEVVLIDTEAHKAIDVFYVTANGRKLGGEKQRELQQALLAMLKG